MRFVYFFLIFPISKLPFRALYKISDILYVLLFKVVGYRRKVVGENIARSFPEKTKKELLEIEQEFFRHLCDLMLETFKAFSIPRSLAHQRISYKNPEVLNQFFKAGRDVILIGGHYGNWELLAITIDDMINHQTLALYSPLKNKFFDSKTKESRGRFGLQLISVPDAKTLINKFGKTQLYTVIYGADQSPRKSQKSLWMNFLRQETGVQFGAEKFARDRNMPVVMGNIYRIKRGLYEVDFDLITDAPNELPVGEITYRFMKRLEKIIDDNPPYWLWSHKRWKITRPDDTPLYHGE